MVNNLGPAPTKVKFAESNAPPILTCVLILLTIGVFYLAYTGKVEPWLSANTFQPIKAIGLFQDKDFLKLATMLGYANFAVLNVWQLLVSIYFVALLGIVVERAIGSPRFFLLIVLGCTIPWAVLSFDVTSTSLAILPWDHSYKGSLNFFSPTLLLFSILGAYMVVAPGRKVNLADYRPRERGQIFNNAPQRPLAERFGFKPRTVMVSFVILATGYHVSLSFYYRGLYGSTTMLSCLTAMGIGYGLASVLLLSAVEVVNDSPLKQKALKHYYELVALDINSADAIKGTSRALGLPVEQIAGWVASNKGKMRIYLEK